MTDKALEAEVEALRLILDPQPSSAERRLLEAYDQLKAELDAAIARAEKAEGALAVLQADTVNLLGGAFGPYHKIAKAADEACRQRDELASLVRDARREDTDWNQWMKETEIALAAITAPSREVIE